MGLRFYRRLHIAPGIGVNLSRSGPSLTLGVRGAHVTLGRRGVTKTVGLSGTGVFFTSRAGYLSGLHTAGASTLSAFVAEQMTPTDSEDAPPNLVAMVRVIGEDRDLQAWFRQLMALPQNLRASAIGRLAAEMHANGEDPELVLAFTALGDIDTCRIVGRVLLDRYGVRIEITEP
ncbi:MAG TPA: DUF4236 domain-containing protein [Gemmatimonadaceae bacterium]|jgi:hypothetical protein|nr:DUF4236 domain-containing protein [Gemmatimonadaceae bacterium]